MSETLGIELYFGTEMITKARKFGGINNVETILLKMFLSEKEKQSNLGWCKD